MISFTFANEISGSGPPPITYMSLFKAIAANPCRGVGIGISSVQVLVAVLYFSLLLNVFSGTVSTPAR